MPFKSHVFVHSAFEFRRERNWLAHFYDFNFGEFERAAVKLEEPAWRRLGEQRALAVFQAAAEFVPAYRDFLRRNKIKPALVKTLADFARVPLTDKQNYIAAYPLADRCFGGRLDRIQHIAMSSGTSGAPTLWPRGGYQLFEAALGHELLLRKLFDIQHRRTLLIIGFPMGVYVSGMAEAQSVQALVHKGYPLTIVTCGNNKTDVLRTVSLLGENYDQVILEGHPFFIKDVLETGKRQGIPWPKLNLGLLFCSEGFSESWRNYILREIGMPARAERAISTYGSSELLLMAYESPLTQFIRKACDRSPKLCQELTGQRAAPSIFQYNPLFRYIESVNGSLVFTAASGAPLIRFNLHDSGRVLGFAEVVEAWQAQGVAAAGLKSKYRGSWRWPLVTLNGRSDQTIIFYAANIYIEHIHLALNHRPFLSSITGKFAMRKGYLKNMDEFLEINIELQPKLRPSKRLAGQIQRQIVKRLREVNLEYLFLCNHLDKDLTPRIKLLPYQHESYFKAGVKPRYIIKET